MKFHRKIKEKMKNKINKQSDLAAFEQRMRTKKFNAFL